MMMVHQKRQISHNYDKINSDIQLLVPGVIIPLSRANCRLCRRRRDLKNSF